jgi:hypothetical protein
MDSVRHMGYVRHMDSVRHTDSVRHSISYVEQVCMMQQGKKEDKLREQIPRGKMDMAGAGRSNESMDSPRSNRSNKV